MGSGVTSAAHEKQGLYPLWLAFVNRHPVALDQLENGNENDRAYSCGDDRPEPPGNRYAKPTADFRADNADDDVSKEAEAAATQGISFARASSRRNSSVVSLLV